MVDLETQLRRYADQVEAEVGAVDVPARTSTRGRIPVVAVVAATLVALVGIALWTTRDVGSNQPAGTPDVIVDDEPSEDENPSQVLDEDDIGDGARDDGSILLRSPFAESPLSPRHSALVLPIDDGSRILVWGGHVESMNIGRADLASAVMNDGAIYDVESDSWSMIAAAPDSLAVAQAPSGIVVPEGVVVARGPGLALYDSEIDEWTEFARLERGIDQWFLLDDGTLVGAGDASVGSLDVSNGVWLQRLELDGPRHSSWTWTSTGRQIWGLVDDPTGAGEVVSWEPELDGASLSWPGRLSGFRDLAWFGDRLVVADESGVVQSWQPGTKVLAETIGTISPNSYEGPPEIRVLDGVLSVEASPGHFVWNGEFFEPRVLPGGVGGAAVARIDGEAVWLTFGLDHPETRGTELFTTPRPGPGDATTVLLGRALIDIPDGFELDGYMTDSAAGVERIALGRTQQAGGCSVEHSLAPADGAGDAHEVVMLEDGKVSVTCSVSAYARTVAAAVSPLATASEWSPAPPAVVVPQLDGLFADTAIQTLRNAGLDVVPVFESVAEDSPFVGRVVDQSPAAFDEVPEGTVVTITIGEAGVLAGDPLPSTSIVGGGPLCASAPAWNGAVTVGSSPRIGPAWPVQEGDLLVQDGPFVHAFDSFNGFEDRGVLVEGDFADGTVHSDGSGGVVAQYDGIGGFVHVSGDRTVRGIELPGPASEYWLGGVAHVDDIPHVYASRIPPDGYEVGMGDLVLVPLGGGPERVVTQIVFEETGARPLWNGRYFVLQWGSLGDVWFSAVDVDGNELDQDWNRWPVGNGFVEGATTLRVGVFEWQVYVAESDPEAGTVTIEGFAAWGDQVHPPETISVDVGLLGLHSIIPLGDRELLVVETPDGPCARVVEFERSFDLPVRGYVTATEGFGWPPDGELGQP